MFLPLSRYAKFYKATIMKTRGTLINTLRNKIEMPKTDSTEEIIYM